MSEQKSCSPGTDAMRQSFAEELLRKGYHPHLGATKDALEAFDIAIAASAVAQGSQARVALDDLHIHAFEVGTNMIIPKVEWDAAFARLSASPPAAAQGSQEPVAWLYEMAHYIKPSDEIPLRDWRRVVTIAPPPKIPKDGVRNVVPLYTSPPSTVAAEAFNEVLKHVRAPNRPDSQRLDRIEEICIAAIGELPPQS